MESDSAEVLRDAERAEAAPFVDYPPTPWWYPVAAGLWVGGVATVVVASLRWSSNGPLVLVPLTLAQMALLVVLGAFIRWYRRRWGSWPVMRNAPAEIRRAYKECGVASVAVLGVTVALWLTLGPLWGAGLLALSFAAMIAWYERRYAAAAQRVRERLS